ncbi:MAG: serine/threonine protein kinase [Alphaproteobacteria bacterium]|nr:serine/threonine protein kinase [Alphaproteobacteria bacterium]
MTTTRSVDPAAFTIRQCLGAGGFGEVYLATLAGHGDVALKVLHNGLDPRSQAVQRLRDEARLLALLDHPSILSIHDLVLLDGRVALVTEYIDGQDLEALLVARPGIPTPAGLEVLADVASALQSAFTTLGPKGKPLGLLHRDIKPGNIRVGRDGSVKLLDFGIAKATGVTREAKTRTSGVLGSFAYMAPERFDPKQADTPAGDVCSLGCVLFELLSGGDMLFGEYDIKDLFGLALMPDRREEALQERLNTLTGVPPSILDLLHEMLAYEPADRPALADLPDRLDTLAGEVPGPRLKPWASAYAWPQPPHLPGGLTGKTITGSSLGPPTSSGSLPQGEPFVPAPDSTGFAARTVSVDDVPRSLTSAPISVDFDLPEAPRRSGPPWAIIAVVGMLVLLLGVGGGIAGAAGLGLFLAGGPEAGPDPEPIVRPTPPDPRPQPVEPPDPTDPVVPAPDGPDAVDPPVPDPPIPPEPGRPDGPQPQPVPVVGPDTPVVDPPPWIPTGDLNPPPPDAVVGTGTGGGRVDGCGTLTDLELNATLGTLAPATRNCLQGLMRDGTMKQTDRAKVGRVLLSDSRAVCDARGDCVRYEAVQREFFEDVDQSDPDMMAAFAEFLFSTANNRQQRLQEVDLWCRRALERQTEWSGADRKRRLTRVNEIRARAAYQRFTLDPNDDNRTLAFQRTAEWAEVLRQYNFDATPAMDLCASAAGSVEKCDRRVTTEAATETVRFMSIPLGAKVRIDGKDVGETMIEVALTHGRHTIVMSHEGVSGENVIQVGGGEASQWRWRKTEGTWEAVF